MLTGKTLCGRKCPDDIFSVCWVPACKKKSSSGNRVEKTIKVQSLFVLALIDSMIRWLFFLKPVLSLVLMTLDQKHLTS